MADLSFIFNEIENYTIIATSNYPLVAVRYQRTKPTEEGLFTFIAQHKIDYIILDEATTEGEVKRIFSQFDLRVGNKIRNLQVKSAENGITVLERVSS